MGAEPSCQDRENGGPRGIQFAGTARSRLASGRSRWSVDQIFRGRSQRSFCWSILLMNSTTSPRIKTRFFLVFVKGPRRWTLRNSHERSLSTERFPYGSVSRGSFSTSKVANTELSPITFCISQVTDHFTDVPKSLSYERAEYVLLRSHWTDATLSGATC